MSRIFSLSIYFLINAVLAQDSFSVFLTTPLFLLIMFNVGRLKSSFVTPDDMFWLLIYLFFVIHPLQAISSGFIGTEGPASSIQYSNSEMIYAIVIVILFALFFSIGRGLALRNSSADPAFTQSALSPNPAWVLVFLAINIASFIAYVASYGLENLLAPRNDQIRENIYLFSQLLLAFQILSVIFLCSFYKKSRHINAWVAGLFALSISLVLLLVSQNPFNSARFFLLGAWGPVAFVLVSGKVRILPFYLCCLAGLSIVFPLLSMTTRFGFGSLDEISNAVSLKMFFSIPDVDVFDTLVHAVRFMDGRALFYGQKTLAIILFFVPRAIWPEKPIVGGLDIGSELLVISNSGTDNLSFFVGGEFYLDFGMPGVIAGGLIGGYLFAKLTSAKFGVLFGENIVPYLMISSLPILVRGPLGAVLPLFTCQIILLWIFRRLFTRHRRINSGTHLRARLDKRTFVSSARWLIPSSQGTPHLEFRQRRTRSGDEFRVSRRFLIDLYDALKQLAARIDH